MCVTLRQPTVLRRDRDKAVWSTAECSSERAHKDSRAKMAHQATDASGLLFAHITQFESRLASLSGGHDLWRLRLRFLRRACKLYKQTIDSTS